MTEFDKRVKAMFEDGDEHGLISNIDTEIANMWETPEETHVWDNSPAPF